MNECRFCEMCGSCENVVTHHLIGGSLRHLADADRLTISLCSRCHTLATRSQDRIHGNPRAEDLSKMLGQMMFERNMCATGMSLDEAHKEFMTRYGRCFI